MHEITETQLEIFCAFVIDFNKLNNTVKAMIKSNSESELGKVKKMYSYVADIMDNGSSVENLLERINEVAVSDRLIKLVKYVNMIMLKDPVNFYQTMTENYKTLDHQLEINHITKNVNAIFEEDLIIADSKAPIDQEDLVFLNNMAKYAVENPEEMAEAEKNLKTLSYRTKIRELYHKNGYYFEQTFSNTAVMVQKKILKIIEDYFEINEPSDEERESYQNLVDISVLTDIDNLAIKSRSNISDHQAFDAFCKILRKNNNKKLINKVLRENIIMTSMFKTNSSTIGEFYALRKMFVSARYPVNQTIIQRYMQLMEKTEAEMGIIFKELKRDFDFNKSYESFIKSKATNEFKNFLNQLMNQLKEDDLTQGTKESLSFVIDSFIFIEKHDEDILTVENIFSYIKIIYEYMVRNNLYKTDQILIRKLKELQRMRIHNYLSERNNLYETNDSSVVYGMAASDFWYELNKFIKDHHVNHIHKFYLKYNEIRGFVFEPLGELQNYDAQISKIDARDLNKDEVLIMTADVDNKNFDIFVYGVFNRAAKSIYRNQMEVQLERVEGGMFRKKTIEGLNKEIEIKLKKMYYNIITLILMHDLEEHVFVEVLKRKVRLIIDDLLEFSITQEEIEKFVLAPLIDIKSFANKSAIREIDKRLSSFNFKTSNKEYLDLYAMIEKLFLRENLEEVYDNQLDENEKK